MRTDIRSDDKVICITEMHAVCRQFFSAMPRKGGIYCVNSIELSVKGTPIIDLVGFRCIPDKNGDEYGFLASNFRRIIPASERNAEANREKK